MESDPLQDEVAAVLSARLAKLNAEGGHLCSPEAVEVIAEHLAKAALENFRAQERTPGSDVGDDLFGHENLSLLDSVLRKRLSALRAEQPAICSADTVDTIAWMLAEAAFEDFVMEERGWIR